MNLLERVLTLLGANLNTVVEKADDPEHVLRQLQLDMHNQLMQVKTQVATAIAESHKLQRRGQERKAEADIWLKKAEVAVRQGNDNSAREALTHYNELNRQVQRYQQQRESQEQLVKTMRNALLQLEAKITEVGTTIDLLAIRKRNALIQQRVYEALKKSGTDKGKEQTLKAQDSVLDEEARAQALAHLQNRAFEAQMDQLTAENAVEDQLQVIKERNSISSQTPSAKERRRQTSPLVSTPQPLEKVQLPDHYKPQKAGSRAETTTSENLDIEQLKEFLDTSKPSTS